MFPQVLVFYVLTLVFTFLLGGVQQVLQISSRAAILPQLAPGVGAVFALVMFRRDQIRLSILDPEIPLPRYLSAVIIPAAGAAVVYLVNRWVMDSPSLTAEIPALPWQLILWMPLGALGEELGWRSYLHRKVDPAVSGLLSSVLVGIFWGVWHVGLYANGFAYMAYFLLLTISYSVVLYALVGDMDFNLLLSALFHLSINLTNLLFLNLINKVAFMQINSLVWAAIAVGAVLGRRVVYYKATHPG